MRLFSIFRLAAILSFGGFISLSAQVRVEIYPFTHADPALIVETVKSLVPGERKVILNPARQELLVVADAETHAKVRDLITRLDRAVPNVQIQVDFSGNGSSSHIGGGIQVSGDILVRPGGGTTGGAIVSPNLQAHQTITSSTTSQFLTVQSGREATLHVGDRIPYLDWLMTRGLVFATAQTTVNWQEVGASLVIQPTVVGEGANRMVKVRVTPELSGLVDGNAYQIRYSKVATEVLARAGQPVDLGGLARQNEFFSRFLVGADKQGSTENLKITLTPKILD